MIIVMLIDVKNFSMVEDRKVMCRIFMVCLCMFLVVVLILVSLVLF